MPVGEVTDQDIKELIELIVAGANDHIDDAIAKFGEDVFRNSLALILTDTATRFGFAVRAKRFRVVEGEEVATLNVTAVIETSKDFMVEFLDSNDWVSKAIEGYNTYKVYIRSADGRDYIHYRNLMSILKWLYELVTGEESG